MFVLTYIRAILYPSTHPSVHLILGGSSVPCAFPFLSFPRRVADFPVYSAFYLLEWSIDIQAPSVWKWKPDPSDCPLAILLPSHDAVSSSRVAIRGHVHYCLWQSWHFLSPSMPIHSPCNNPMRYILLSSTFYRRSTRDSLNNSPKLLNGGTRFKSSYLTPNPHS